GDGVPAVAEPAFDRRDGGFPGDDPFQPRRVNFSRTHGTVPEKDPSDGTLTEIGAVARLVVRVVEQVVPFGARHHGGQPVALVALGGEGGQRLLGRLGGGA